jgi:hypothetical protein
MGKGTDHPVIAKGCPCDDPAVHIFVERTGFSRRHALANGLCEFFPTLDFEGFTFGAVNDRPFLIRKVIRGAGKNQPDFLQQPWVIPDFTDIPHMADSSHDQPGFSLFDFLNGLVDPRIESRETQPDGKSYGQSHETGDEFGENPESSPLDVEVLLSQIAGKLLGDGPCDKAHGAKNHKRTGDGPRNPPAPDGDG